MTGGGFSWVWKKKGVCVGGNMTLCVFGGGGAMKFNVFESKVLCFCSEAEHCFAVYYSRAYYSQFALFI